MRPFVLQSPDQFLPDPPPLHSQEWAEAFNQIKADGAALLTAMVNLVGADALISTPARQIPLPVLAAVTAIDPSAVVADGFGPVPGYDDGNPARVEQTGWRPLLTTPPPNTQSRTACSRRRWPRCSAPTSAPNPIDLDIHGFDPAGLAGAPVGRAAPPLLRRRRRRARPLDREIRPRARLATRQLARAAARLEDTG